MGHVGRFTAVDAVSYPRTTRVVLRTSRGLELGEVLAPGETAGESDGSILRGMTIEDQLLEARLEKNRQDAVQACAARIGELGLPATLLDVELLFDGRRLFFYFLGDVPPQLEPFTEELANLYDARVQFSQFADTLAHGCGPGCGTAEAEGAGCGSCGTGCAVAGACGTRRN